MGTLDERPQYAFSCQHLDESAFDKFTKCSNVILMSATEKVLSNWVTRASRFIDFNSCQPDGTELN